MRYYNIKNVEFKNAYGQTVLVKDILPITISDSQAVSVKIQGALDEIASRVDIYGQDHESDAYKIFIENVKILSFVGYDLSKVKSLRIPI